MADRVKAAADARTDSDFYLIARTDAIASHGVDAAIERALACVEAGADAIFAEAAYDLPTYDRFVKAVKVPVLANITEFGKTRYSRSRNSRAWAWAWCSTRCRRSAP